jgi:hypothetical protein
MGTLIRQAQADPSQKNIERVRRYLRRHPMALAMATPAEVAWLKSVGLF